MSTFVASFLVHGSPIVRDLGIREDMVSRVVALCLEVLRAASRRLSSIWRRRLFVANKARSTFRFLDPSVHFCRTRHVEVSVSARFLHDQLGATDLYINTSCRSLLSRRRRSHDPVSLPSPRAITPSRHHVEICPIRTMTTCRDASCRCSWVDKHHTA
jgi:hypothetical protein